MGIIKRFQIAKIKLNQITTARTNERALQLKAERIRLENKNKAIKEYNSEKKKIIAAKKVKKNTRFRNAASTLRQKNATRFSNTQSDSSGLGMSGGQAHFTNLGNNSASNHFLGMKTPKLKTKKKTKKKTRGTTINIRL